jgi:hypothetical protein
MRLFFLCLLLLPTLTFAQSPDKDKSNVLARKWYIGANFGPDFYYGDLNASKYLPKKSVSIAGSLFAEYHFSNVLGLRYQLLIGGLNGSKPVTFEGATADLAFTGLFLNPNFDLTINFSNLFSPNKPSRRFFVYGTVGLGYAVWFSKILNKVYPSDSIDLNTFVNMAVEIPVGLGAMYNINKKLQVSVEWTFRTFLSDKVDNTVGGYKFDIVDYLAFGIAFNLGGKGVKKSPNVVDYPYQVTPVIYESPPPARIEPQPQPQQITPPPIQPDEYVYKVQICAFNQHNYSADWIRKHYRVNQPVTREQEGTMSRYTVGGYSNMQKAKELRNEMLKLGIHDVFIIAYKDGIRHHTVIVE